MRTVTISLIFITCLLITAVTSEAQSRAGKKDPVVLKLAALEKKMEGLKEKLQLVKENQELMLKEISTCRMRVRR